MYLENFINSIRNLHKDIKGYTTNWTTILSIFYTTKGTDTGISIMPRALFLLVVEI